MTDKIQPSEMVHTKCSCVNCGEITHRDAPLSATISMGTVCRWGDFSNLVLIDQL